MRNSDQDTFLKKLPQNGVPIGNTKLKTELKWDDEKYWRIRSELISGGVIAKARGYGGSVFLLNPTEKIKDTKQKKRISEKSLYKDFKETVERQFARDYDLKNYVCEITGNQGSKKTGGLWTRPDVTIISVNSYSFYPGKVLDVITFEIKTFDAFNITGVFETAAHTRFSTKSFLSAYLPDGWNKDLLDYERIKAECERFGIGLLYFKDPKNYDTFEILVEPARKEPDPADIDEFIKTQIKDDNNRTKISEFLR